MLSGTAGCAGSSLLSVMCNNFVCRQHAGWNKLPGLYWTKLSSLSSCRATKVSGVGQSRQAPQLRSKIVAYAGNDEVIDW